MRYPRYMFVTSVSNLGRWWEVVEEEDQCTPEELESILHYMLAATQQFDFHHDPNATTDTGIVITSLHHSASQFPEKRCTQINCSYVSKISCPAT